MTALKMTKEAVHEDRLPALAQERNLDRAAGVAGSSTEVSADYGALVREKVFTTWKVGTDADAALKTAALHENLKHDKVG